MLQFYFFLQLKLSNFITDDIICIMNLSINIVNSTNFYRFLHSFQFLKEPLNLNKIQTNNLL